MMNPRTASQILSAVQETLSTKDTSSVTVVGHSLGAALALLDGVSLSLMLPSATVRVVSYGMPRIGNQAFVDFVDSQLGGRVTHVNNEKDPVPILPGRVLGFHHPSGEIHIQDSGAWDACPGAFPSLSVSFWYGVFNR
jgi:predicted lipase